MGYLLMVHGQKPMSVWPAYVVAAEPGIPWDSRINTPLQTGIGHMTVDCWLCTLGDASPSRPVCCWFETLLSTRIFHSLFLLSCGGHHWLVTHVVSIGLVSDILCVWSSCYRSAPGFVGSVSYIAGGWRLFDAGDGCPCLGGLVLLGVLIGGIHWWQSVYFGWFLC